MIFIYKKRKSVKIYIYQSYKTNNKNLEFEPKQLEQISKCKTMFFCTNSIISNIPHNITNVQFCTEFNKDILQYLHSNVEQIAFGNEFNNSVFNLPQFLINLQFGEKFNQDVKNLPTGLKRLVFGQNFNNPVEYLPDGLEILSFGMCFNQDISQLPNSIKFISFGCHFSKSINNLSTNQNLEQIVFSPSSQFNSDIKCLPPNIKLISFPSKYYGMINLTCGYNCIKCIKFSHYYPKKNFTELEKYKDFVIFDSDCNYPTLKTLEKFKNFHRIEKT